jgi:hypothetical protein
VVATHTINKNDRSALSAIAIEAKENLARNLYRTGGQRISQWKTNRNLQTSITTIVAQPEQGKSNENGTTRIIW